VSTDERPYAKAGKLTKKEMGNGIHNCNPKSLKTVKVQRSSEEPKSRDIPKLMKQLEKSRSKSNIITGEWKATVFFAVGFTGHNIKHSVTTGIILLCPIYGEAD
jgi:hypothetical protein